MPCDSGSRWSSAPRSGFDRESLQALFSTASRMTTRPGAGADRNNLNLNLQGLSSNHYRSGRRACTPIPEDSVFRAMNARGRASATGDFCAGSCTDGSQRESTQDGEPDQLPSHLKGVTLLAMPSGLRAHNNSLVLANDTIMRRNRTQKDQRPARMVAVHDNTRVELSNVRLVPRHHDPIPRRASRARSSTRAASHRCKPRGTFRIVRTAVMMLRGSLAGRWPT